MRSTLQKREKTILVITLLLSGLFVLDKFVVSNMLSSWSRLNSDIDTQEALLKRDRHILSQKNQIVEEYKDYALTLVANLESADAMTPFLKEIEKLARRSRVKIKDMKPLSSQDQKQEQETAVSVVTESPWRNLAKFVYQLQNSPQMLQVKKANLHAKTEGSTRMTARLLIEKSTGL